MNNEPVKFLPTDNINQSCLSRFQSDAASNSYRSSNKVAEEIASQIVNEKDRAWMLAYLERKLQLYQENWDLKVALDQSRRFGRAMFFTSIIMALVYAVAFSVMVTSSHP